MKETFGERFSRLRKSKNLTQQEIADKIGITFQSVSKWEKDINLPDINVLLKLSQILGVSVDLLLGKESLPTIVDNTRNKDNLILKIMVIGKEKVTVNLPVKIIKLLLETSNNVPGVNISNKNIDFDEIFRLIDSGVIGTLLQIESDDEVIIISVE